MNGLAMIAKDLEILTYKAVEQFVENQGVSDDEFKKNLGLGLVLVQQIAWINGLVLLG